MKKAEKDFIGRNKEILVKSLKRVNLNIFAVILADVLFYLVLAYLSFRWLQDVKARVDAFSLPQNIAAIGEAGIWQLSSDIQSFFFTLAISLVFFMLAVTAVASIFKGFIWAKTTSTKLTVALMLKFFWLNVMWIGLWCVIFFLAAFAAEPAALPKAMMVLLVISFYFTNTLYTIFMKKQSFMAIPEALKLNVSRISIFVLPYIAVILGFYLVFRIRDIDHEYSFFIFGAAFLAFAALVRYYMSELVVSYNAS